LSFHPEITDSTSLAEFSKELLGGDKIAPADIVLLSCTTLTCSRFSPENVRRALAAEQREWAAIRVDSVRKFKGLESPVVVLLDAEDALSDLSVLYTALSRAQLRLCVVGIPGPLPLESGS
jgi:hypothetical protein